jgi:archaellum component FlaC
MKLSSTFFISAARLTQMREDMSELKLPLGALENRYVSMSNKLDRIDSRIKRIERRLDLTDA